MRTLERLMTLNRMRNAGLDWGLTGEYSIERLNACCDLLEQERMDPGLFKPYPAMQCALLDDFAFLPLYRELRRYGIEDARIDAWLKAEETTGCRLAGHTAKELLPAFLADLPDMAAAQEYFLYYLGRSLSKQQLETVQDNIRYVRGKYIPSLSALDEAQRGLLLHPFLRAFLPRSEMPQSLPLLAASPLVTGFLDQLYEKGLHIDCTLGRLRLLAALDADGFARLRAALDALGGEPNVMERFLVLWLDNGGHAGDLDAFLAAAKKRTPEQLAAALENRLAYLNLLYGGALDGVPFQDVPGHALPLLAYALARRQKAFLQLVTRDFASFTALPAGCMLFCNAFFTRVHLNALTPRDLAACQKDGASMDGEKALAALEQRPYTFAELRALWGANVRYARFYNRLAVPRIDGRLLVLRQLLKRRLLPELPDGAMDCLAAHLSEKPLFAWRDQDLAHIRGLTYRQCVLLLAAYDRIGRFLPDISTEYEAAFAIRQTDALSGYARWQDVLDDVEHLDTAWARLREELGLDDAFVEENHGHIIPFLLQEGASIATSYEGCLSDPEGFQRIVRAQLMGQYHTLKYFRNDLDREISYPITEAQKLRWMENASLTRDGFEVSERDDFFTTMRIGDVPEYTCLNYRTGSHRECLLACFDSNKKFLFATLNGKPVARAMLRLTKGREQAGPGEGVSLEFADLRNDPGNTSETPAGETLTLFLEAPYTNGLNENDVHLVKELFVQLAVLKAAQLGALPVLSGHYAKEASGIGFTAMRFALYISRSKAGRQYLDSLQGANTTADEDSYKSGRFLLSAKQVQNSSERDG